MFFLFLGTLLILAAGAVILLFVMRLRLIEAAAAHPSPVILAGRYRPMLRLLSDDDFRFVSANPEMRKALLAQRRGLFRSYLRCLARDYGTLLAGLRHAMAQSGVDRPDLAHALVRNRLVFAIALCKAEIRVALFAAGIGRVDVSGLVGALDSLRAQAGMLQPASVAAR